MPTILHSGRAVTLRANMQTLWEKPEQANAIILNVYRGGSWNSAANFARTTHRGGDEPMAKYKNIGFRLVRVP